MNLDNLSGAHQRTGGSHYLPPVTGRGRYTPLQPAFFNYCMKFLLLDCRCLQRIGTRQEIFVFQSIFRVIIFSSPKTAQDKNMEVCYDD